MVDLERENTLFSPGVAIYLYFLLGDCKNLTRSSEKRINKLYLIFLDCHFTLRKFHLQLIHLMALISHEDKIC